ncbi:MAG: membrane protein insertion efficiency factor YidD [Candidatus Berkelbacteria bacterium]|nr:membrane protein insertion efficiency factor YidD [Candidatus Berkelbacteria bacterium]
MCKKVALKTIRIYQKTLSPDHGFISSFFPNGYCCFEPTCSEYTYIAVNRYGAFKGSFLGLRRILRCNPWSKGGYDPVR